MKIGVLSLQGDFFEHCQALKQIGVTPVQIRQAKDLEGISGLIIPGGESTTMSILLDDFGMRKKIVQLARRGMPVFGTCAGAILAGKKIVSEKKVKPLGLIDIKIERNSYGRQVDSFESPLDVSGAGKINGVFIRAPVIKKTGRGVEILCRLGKTPVFVREKNVFASTFHPELSGNTKVHEMFAKEAEKYSKK